MVDALRRAHRTVAPDGIVVDLHPNASPPVVEIGNRPTGHVDVDDGAHRHAAADAAIATVLREGLFAIERVAQFAFHTYADTIDELRDYIEENWRDARFDGITVSRTREAARERPGERPRAREQVILTVMRPRSQPVV